MKPVSVCIIVKNEKVHIENCLRALKNYDVETVVVDTGSTDGTKELALKYTSSVYEFEWCDDFAKAKNFAASVAKNNYIISVDADEYVTSLDVDEIIELLDRHPNATGEIDLRNVVKDGDGKSYNYVEVTRIYDRRYVEFKGSIHEQLVRMDGKKNESAKLKMSVDHYGYFLTEEDLALKNERNIELLKNELKKEKTPYLLFQLGQAYEGTKNFKKAYECLKEAVLLNPPDDAPFLEPLILDYGNMCLETEKFKEALALDTYYDDMCHIGDYMFLLGRIYLANDMGEEAILAFRAALTTHKVYCEGMNNLQPLNALAIIYEDMGEKALAEKCKKIIEDIKNKG